MSFQNGPAPSEAATNPNQLREESNSLFAAALSVGVIGAVSAVVGGALCPVCVVAAPALVGAGAYKRWRSTRATPRAEQR